MKLPIAQIQIRRWFHMRRSELSTSMEIMVMMANSGRQCWSNGKEPKKI